MPYCPDPHCDRWFGSHVQLEDHQQAEHPTLVPCPVEDCDQTFPSRSVLAGHMTLTHPKVPFGTAFDPERRRTAYVDNRGPREHWSSLILACRDCLVLANSADSIDEHCRSVHRRPASRLERTPLTGEVREAALARAEQPRSRRSTQTERRNTVGR